MGGGRTRTESCDIDMTPMIDVVFQLIIFFLVAIHLTDRSNPEIQLERGPHGARVTRDEDKSTLTVEIDNRGHVSISNMRMNLDSLRQIIQARHDRIGPYPLLIRGDLRTKHADVRKVMDMCTAIGLHSVRFAAIKEERPGR